MIAKCPALALIGTTSEWVGRREGRGTHASPGSRLASNPHLDALFEALFFYDEL
jgi:hypothetical protein